MENKPLFSIVIPVYNRGYILPETIESIRQQTFPQWEVLLVDDGSTDNTREVAAEICRKESRVRYIWQKNAERSAARNNGAAQASGDWLLFLDSDDKYHPNHLQHIFDHLKSLNFNPCMCFTGVTYLNEAGDLVQGKMPVMQANSAFEYLLLNPITPTRVCIHKQIFGDFRFDPEIVIVEDLVLWVCIASRYPVHQIPVFSAIYRIHQGNSVDLSRNSYLSRYKGLLRFFNHPVYSLVSEKIPSKIKKHLLAEVCFNMARHYDFVEKKMNVWQMLFLSFLYKPGYRNKERLFLGLCNLAPIHGYFRKRRSRMPA